MIDKYIILNRKPNLIIKTFIANIFLLTGITIFGINTLTYQEYFHFHSQISNLNSYYYLKVLVPVKEVKKIVNQNTIEIENKTYQYKVIKTETKVIYKNKTNYINVYLEVNKLEEKYQLDNYHINVKIKKEKKKIIEYIKNKEDFK